MKHSTIETPGGERLVLVPVADYEAMVARIEEADEDAADVAAYDAGLAALADGPSRVLSPEILRGALIRSQRKAHGMTQAQLADAVGVGQGFVSDIESGRRSAPGETAQRIAATLGFPVESLT